jgi:hypothetical protein
MWPQPSVCAYGQLDIDMVAGPSEVLIIADESARADYVAADLISQAEQTCWPLPCPYHQPKGPSR